MVTPGVAESSIEDDTVPLYNKASLPGLPREIREMIYHYAYDDQLVLWIMSNTDGAFLTFRLYITKNPRENPPVSLNRQMRNELISRVTVHVRKNEPATASRVLTELSLRGIPSPVKIQLLVHPRAEFFDKANGYGDLQRILWATNADFLGSTPNLEYLQIQWPYEKPFHFDKVSQFLKHLMKGHPILKVLSQRKTNNGMDFFLTK